MAQSAEDLGSQRWNVARGIATDVISVVLSVVDVESGHVTRSNVDSEALTNAVEQVRSESDYWPFENVEEVFYAVAQKAEFSDGPDGVNELGRYISARLVGEADRVEPPETDDMPDQNSKQIETEDIVENNHIESSENGQSDVSETGESDVSINGYSDVSGDETSDSSTNGHVEGDDGSALTDSSETDGDEQTIVPPEDLGSQRWNVARGIASDTATAILDVVDVEDGSVSRSDVDKQELNEVVETLRSQHDYWPFEDVDEVFDALSQKAGFSDGPDGVNELGRYVSARLVDETDRVTPNGSYEQLDIEASSDTGEKTGELDEEQDVETDPTVQSENQDTDSVERVSVGDGSDTFQIATDLYYCFLEQDKKFTEIKQEYDGKFPPRSVLLTDVVNTSGSVEERIRQIEHYVAEWYQDDDAVEKLSKYKRKPMGA